MLHFNSIIKTTPDSKKIGSLQDMLTDNSLNSVYKLIKLLNLKIKKGSIAELKMKEQELLNKYI